MKKISRYNLSLKIFTFIFVLFGFWDVFLNISSGEKKASFIAFAFVFLSIALLLFAFSCKKICFSETEITFTNIFFQKRKINIADIKDISFSRAQSEKYVEIKTQNKVVNIGYSNKKIETEFTAILRTIPRF